MKYVKKPIPVDAWQIDTLEIENMGNYPNFVRHGLAIEQAFTPSKDEAGRVCLKIITLEGVMTAYDGDYLVRGSEGEWWFVKKSIFEKTYEEYTEPPARGQIEVEEITDLEDGGAIFAFNMHHEDMKMFAKEGIIYVLTESLKELEKKHGLD